MSLVYSTLFHPHSILQVSFEAGGVIVEQKKITWLALVNPAAGRRWAVLYCTSSVRIPTPTLQAGIKYDSLRPRPDATKSPCKPNEEWESEEKRGGMRKHQIRP